MVQEDSAKRGVADASLAVAVFVLLLSAPMSAVAQTTAAPAGGNNITNCSAVNGTSSNSTGNATCPNATTTAAPPTTTLPPTTTTLAPTPMPPTLSPCERARFACDDTMWRCVRGSAFNRCGCLATYWKCLVDTTCGGPTEDDAATCADRASGLRCDTYDARSGLRVCPEDAGVVYDHSGGGWIAALVFMCLALVLLLASLAYIGAIRGWYRQSSGRLVFDGRTPVEDQAKALAHRWFPKSRLGRAYAREQRHKARRQQRPPSGGNGDDDGDHSPTAAAPVPAAADVPGAEPPEMIVLAPDGVERYRKYLREQYDASRAERRQQRKQDGRDSATSSSDDRPALLRTPIAVMPEGGADGSRPRRGLAVSKEHRDFERRYEAEMAALRRGSASDQDALAQAALEVDVAEREIAAERGRLAAMLEREKESLVREAALGREALRGPLPSELDVSPVRGVSRRAVSADTFASSPMSGERRGDLRAPNPIASLFADHSLAAPGASLPTAGIRVASAANPPEVDALGSDEPFRAASGSAPRYSPRREEVPGGGLTMAQLTALDATLRPAVPRNPMDALARSNHDADDRRDGPHPLLMFARGASPAPSL